MILFSAEPLEKFSALHSIPILSLLGIKSKFSPSVSVIFNFNLQTPLLQNPQAQLTFHVRDSNQPPLLEKPDFCITNLKRWRLDISQFSSFTNYLQKMKRKHYMRYNETKKTFTDYGAKISLIEGDWSQYVDMFYPLYMKVAEKHGTQLYDINFFRMVAKNSSYKLLCAWYNNLLIGALVLVDEQPVFHSICCGLDYEHSKNSQAYSQLHYEFIRLAIESKKYTIADVGITADQAKSNLDFQPVSACMDIWVHNRCIRPLLRGLSSIMSATINSKAKLELSFHLPQKK